jgi:hypothetical protein
MHRSPQEITAVQQASAGLLGFACPGKPLRTRYRSTRLVAEWLDPLLLAYKARWVSLSSFHSIPVFHLPLIEQSTEQASSPATSPGSERPSLPTMWGLNKPVDEPGASWPGIAVGLFASFAGILYG